MQAPQQNLSRSTTIVLHFGFIVTGVVTTMLGPLIPALSTQWQLSDAQAGALFTAQFISATLATLVSRQIVARLGTKRTLVASFGLMTLGVVGVGTGGWGLGLVAVCSYGIALGLIIPSLNLLIAEINATRRAAALNVLNFAWSLGAIISAPLITFLLHDASIVRPLLVIASLLFLATIALLSSSLPEQLSQPQGPIPARKSARMNVWLIGLLAFLYGGTETPIAGWIASYALRINEAPAEMKSLWGLTPSIFWAALMGGRLLAPLSFRHGAESTVILLGLGMANLGIALLFFVSSPALLLTSIGLIGFGLAPFFPTTVALFPQYFGAASAKIAPFIFALGGLGGATFPWVVGLVSTQFGTLRLGLIAPMLCGLTMMGLQICATGLCTRKTHIK